MKKRIIVILGMHRSGTSALTRGLDVLGVSLGERLMGGVSGINDKGFWEDEDVVSLNEQILSFLGRKWDSVNPIREAEFSRLLQSPYKETAVKTISIKSRGTDLLGLKDPRFCVLLPFWQQVFQAAEVEPLYVLAVRNPLSICDSLAKRNAFDKRRAYYLWLMHVAMPLAARAVVNEAIVVDYDELLKDPAREFGRIGRHFSLPVGQESLRTYCKEFLEENLRHSQYGLQDLVEDKTCPSQVIDIYQRLVAHAVDGNGADRQNLHATACAYLADISKFYPLLEFVDQCDDERMHLAALSKKLHAKINEQGSIRTHLDQYAQETESLQKAVEEYGAEVQRLHEESRTQQMELAQTRLALEERDGWLASARAEIEAIKLSTSWRVTGPLRAGGRTYRRARNVTYRVKSGVIRQGGMAPALRKAAAIFRQEGIRGLAERLRAQTVSGGRILPTHRPISNIPFRPYYLSPLYQITKEDLGRSVPTAVHLHLYHEDLLEQIVEYLNNVPYEFDLYVSVKEGADIDALSRRISQTLFRLGKLVVEDVPNRGRDIAPFIVQFGDRLRKYDIVGHIHTKKSPHAVALSNWLKNILCLLFGEPGSDGRQVVQIFNLLREGAKIVYPEGPLSISVDRSGWADNHRYAGELLTKFTDYRIEDFPVVEFPQGTMFWARGDRISDFLNLPLKWDDFPDEPIPPDGTIAHALERLVLIMTSRFDGQCIKLCSRDSVDDYPYYEDQQDFSARIASDVPKVLAYYLPQFHPTPENDEWHGKGFTEWTKVRAATPLFVEHYQQHIPHQDIGYYLLDSPDVLAQQADMMKKAGVYGQIFYHYWFAGRLILEKPARMLLENSQIDMPFCFCWANENWTRRWDGNESEILLAQNYSTKDATEFIKYLIPFFKDSRYITINGRPLMFVYRASSIPNPQAYVETWASECEAQGIPQPYVVAVLTRGATDPRHFGMEAATERVLHDWTAGGAPEISGTLQMYSEFRGSVLSYNAVADFYMEKAPETDFTSFRSLVPIWDNTARYGSEAYVLHGSTPEKFQSWLECLLKQSSARNAADKQFVVINAWNEWAEGAHLEPDTRYGYAYLNSVGRALTGESFSHVRYVAENHLKTVRVKLEFPQFVVDTLQANPRLKRRFLGCLAKSTLFDKCVVECSDEYWIPELRSILPGIPIHSLTGEPIHYTLLVGKPSVFASTALESMLRMAIAYPSAVIAGNAYGDGEELYYVETNMSVDRCAAHGNPFSFYPSYQGDTQKVFKICPEARFFVAPKDTYVDGKDLAVVTTIIRVHAAAPLSELDNALLSLLAMRDSIVVPYIAAQDLSDLQKSKLERLVFSYPWDSVHSPVIRYFESANGEEDLRSVMLNESLQAVQTGYMAFLDYDDLMLPTAYGQLAHRLRITGKAVTFGRVYASLYNPQQQRIMERRRTYEYGYSYSDFINANLAPIHSFLVDVERVDLRDLTWYRDQKFMEDYLLTLQLFSAENGDWDSLSVPNYVGDYMHKDDGSNTLAIVDAEKRALILNTPLYRLCEARIMEMRRKRRSRSRSSNGSSHDIA